MNTRTTYTNKLNTHFWASVFLVIIYSLGNVAQKNNTQDILVANKYIEATTSKEIPPEANSQVVVRAQALVTPIKKKIVTEQITPPTPAKQIIPTRLEVMAWLYPGEPACNASHEFQTAKNISILKPEYFIINEEGILTLMTVEHFGCNGYSAQNIANIKRYSISQYATISSSYAQSMNTFLKQSLEEEANIRTLVTFAVDNNITGIEIDFEDFGGWNQEIYTNYKLFVTKLGEALHAKNKKLMIDGPAISNDEEQGWFVWKYEDFTTLPIDTMVVMAYDYQYDQGAGSPVSPLVWITNIISWTKIHYKNQDKITIGIPSYGYKGVSGTQKIQLLTHEQIKKEVGFSTATRDTRSAEMTWNNGTNVYFYQDSASILQKINTVTASGIHSISIWHLGGNMWFTE